MAAILTKSLSLLASELKISFDNSDWDSIRELDTHVRNQLQNAISTMASEERLSLIRWLESYQRIYELLIKGAEAHKEEIAVELRKIKKESKAADMYLNSSRYLG